MRRFFVVNLALSLFVATLSRAATTTTSPTTLPEAPSPSEPADQAAPRMGHNGQVSDYFMKMHIMFLQQRSWGESISYSWATL